MSRRSRAVASVWASGETCSAQYRRVRFAVVVRVRQISRLRCGSEADPFLWCVDEGARAEKGEKAREMAFGVG